MPTYYIKILSNYIQSNFSYELNLIKQQLFDLKTFVS